MKTYKQKITCRRQVKQTTRHEGKELCKLGKGSKKEKCQQTWKQALGCCCGKITQELRDSHYYQECQRKSHKQPSLRTTADEQGDKAFCGVSLTFKTLSNKKFLQWSRQSPSSLLKTLQDKMGPHLELYISALFKTTRESLSAGASLYSAGFWPVNSSCGSPILNQRSSLYHQFPSREGTQPRHPCSDRRLFTSSYNCATAWHTTMGFLHPPWSHWVSASS